MLWHALVSCDAMVSSVSLVSSDSVRGAAVDTFTMETSGWDPISGLKRVGSPGEWVRG